MSFLSETLGKADDGSQACPHPSAPCPTEGEAIDAIFCILDDFDPAAQWRILVHQRLRHLHDYQDFERMKEIDA